MPRTLAIGDIHGCLKSLTALIEDVGPNRDDVVIMLGDYIDRGPNSKGVVDWLLGDAHPFELICLQGNHEVMVKQARSDEVAFRGWVAAGGRHTLESYRPASIESLSLDDITEAHWEFLDHQLRPYHETETHIFVHANPAPNRDMANQRDYSLYWEFRTSPNPHQSGKPIVRGHVHQADGLPLDGPNGVCIDTGAGYGGWLTCFEPATGHVWQANERSETRQFSIDSPPDSLLR